MTSSTRFPMESATGISRSLSIDCETYSTTIPASVNTRISSDWSIKRRKISPSEKPDGRNDCVESWFELVKVGERNWRMIKQYYRTGGLFSYLTKRSHSSPKGKIGKFFSKICSFRYVYILLQVVDFVKLAKIRSQRVRSILLNCIHEKNPDCRRRGGVG
jgi:hypothetical protein